jgi:hypothetical protein
MALGNFYPFSAAPQPKFPLLEEAGEEEGLLLKLEEYFNVRVWVFFYGRGWFQAVLIINLNLAKII